MKFNTVFIAHVPDADPTEHKSVVETDLYKLFVRLVKDQQQALGIVSDLVDQEDLHSVVLCPGFTNEEVAEVSRVAGPEIGVSVVRGDGPSSKIAKQTMERAGWFGQE